MGNDEGSPGCGTAKFDGIGGSAMNGGTVDPGNCWDCAVNKMLINKIEKIVISLNMVSVDDSEKNKMGIR